MKKKKPVLSVSNLANEVIWPMFSDLYRNHPSFCSLGLGKEFSCSYLPISPLAEQLESIWLYSSHMRGASYIKLSSNERKDLRQESIFLLESIFSVLASQLFSESPETKWFLDDLLFESKALLRRDFQALSFYDLNSVRQSQPFNRSSECGFSVGQFFDKGYSFAALPATLADDLLSILRPEIKELKIREKNGCIKREDLSTNSGELVYRATQLLDAATHGAGINEIMSCYLGFKAGVTGLAVEIGSSSSTWTNSCYEGLEPSTLYMHRDESFAHPKLFLYLTKIDRDNGAFSVLENSDNFHGKPSYLQSLIGRIVSRVGRDKQHHSYGYWQHVYHHAFGCRHFRRQFMKLPSEMRYCSHYGWDVQPDSKLHAELLESERFLEGDPGSCIIFDGYRVTHKALVKSNCEHISIQAIFGPKSKPSFAQKVVNKSRDFARKARTIRVSGH